MYSKTSTPESTGSCSARIVRLQEALAQSDALLIGAGSGLSASAGFTYDGERFRRYFADFIARYGYRDMYSAGFYPYPSPEEYWAYWSRHIYYNRYVPAPKPVYDALLRLAAGRDYFVITTNVDHCFQKAGFDKRRLFYTQGDYGLFQCVDGCGGKTYDNEAVVRQMLERQQNRRIPGELIPRCPLCGKPMTVNLRYDDRFVQDEGWYRAQARYADFVRTHAGGRVVYLELGVGGNTPVIIKYPFWRMTAQNPRAVYACVNRGEAEAPAEIADRSICLNADIGMVLQELAPAPGEGAL